MEGNKGTMSRPTFDPIARGPKKAGGREVERAKGFEVTFSVDAETEFGDQLLVVGSAPALGAWDPRKGMIMHTDRKSYPRLGASPRIVGCCDSHSRHIGIPLCFFD
jgi:hypothetical protein